MVIYLGSLVQLCCGEGGTLQTDTTGVCRECLQCLDHIGFAPAHGMCAFPVYTAQAPGCSARELSKAGPGLHVLPRSKPLRFRFWVLYKGTDLVGPVFCALPRSEQLRQQMLGQCTLCRCSASYHLPGPSLTVSWVHSGSAASSVPYVSSGELISGCDPPGRCQPSRIPGRFG